MHTYTDGKFGRIVFAKQQDCSRQIKGNRQMKYYIYISALLSLPLTAAAASVTSTCSGRVTTAQEQTFFARSGPIEPVFTYDYGSGTYSSALSVCVHSNVAGVISSVSVLKPLAYSTDGGIFPGTVIQSGRGCRIKPLVRSDDQWEIVFRVDGLPSNHWGKVVDPELLIAENSVVTPESKLDMYTTYQIHRRLDLSDPVHGGYGPIQWDTEIPIRSGGVSLSHAVVELEEGTDSDLTIPVNYFGDSNLVSSVTYALDQKNDGVDVTFPDGTYKFPDTEQHSSVNVKVKAARGSAGAHQRVLTSTINCN